MLPSLKSLIAFEACARHLSIANAAEELSVTQSAISQNIKLLETQLGFDLFIRKNRKIELSPQGLQYYPTIYQALNSIRSQTQIISNKSENNILSIKLNTSFAHQWLLPLLKSFTKKYPFINIKIQTEDWPQLDKVKTSTDIEIINGHTDKQLHSEILCKEYWLAVCSPSFLSKNHNELEQGKLNSLPGIYVAGYSEGWYEWLYKNPQFTTPPIKNFEVDNSIMGLKLVTQDLGVMLCRSLNALPLLENGSIQLLKQDIIPSTEHHYLRYDKSKQSPKVTLFIDWIQQYFIKNLPEKKLFSILNEKQMLPKQHKNTYLER